MKGTKDREIALVDYFDRVVGSAPVGYAHDRGLLHRSVQVFLFKHADYESLLVQKRSRVHAEEPLKLSPSAAGHVDFGEDYLKAALRELKEEIFWGQELPPSLKLAEVAKGYQNDEPGECPEYSTLYYAVYSGSFSPNPEEVEEISFRPISKVAEDQTIYPQLYTFSFRNAMQYFHEWSATHLAAANASPSTHRNH